MAITYLTGILKTTIALYGESGTICQMMPYPYGKICRMVTGPSSVAHNYKSHDVYSLKAKEVFLSKEAFKSPLTGLNLNHGFNWFNNWNFHSLYVARP